MLLERERNRALEKARAFAASGNAVWAQLWLDRANQFWPVTTLQLANVQRLSPNARASASESMWRVCTARNTQNSLFLHSRRMSERPKSEHVAYWLSSMPTARSVHVAGSVSSRAMATVW